jgi:integrase
MLKQAVRWQLIARNPAADLELPSVPKLDMVTLTREQAGELLLAAQRRPLMRTLVLLGMATGARLGELLALRWADIDLDIGTARIGPVAPDRGRADAGQGTQD